MSSPPPVPDLRISAGLEDILEMPAVEATHEMVNPIETVPRADVSYGMFFYILWCHAADFVKFDIGCAGAYDGGDADAGLCQMVQGQSLVGVEDRDEGQVIDYIKHIRWRVIFSDIVSGCAGSLFDEGPREWAGSGGRTGGGVVELEENNAKLLAELEQTRLALAEADAMPYARLKDS
jgi:hypothetical protein